MTQKVLRGISLKASKKKTMHSKSGWRFALVNNILEEIHDLFEKNALTFVEEMVILEWFKCEMIYNLGKTASKDYFDEAITKYTNIPISKSGRMYQ